MRFITLVAIFFITACSNTAEVQQTWAAPDIKERDLSGTLVVAISDNKDRQKTFENRYVEKLKAQGVRAMPSYLIDKKKIESEDVIAFANENNLDTVLVTVYVGSNDFEMFHRGTTYYGVQPMYQDYYGGFRRYYGVLHEVGHTPSYFTSHKELFLVTSIYEVKTKELLWNTASSAMQAGDPRNLMDPFIDSFIGQMKKDGLVN
ncbi:hypothetical protein ACFSJY_01845 [Thalassotalea euphylliae]|uniref:hypothetical protein n=1 Tax=Thalassotalea euphylliae TaxID=1655234 RepID=UPI0036447C20